MSSAWEFTSSKLVNVMPAANHSEPCCSFTHAGCVFMIASRTFCGVGFSPKRPAFGIMEVGKTCTKGNVVIWWIVGTRRFEL